MSTENSSTKTTWTRAPHHPQVTIKPLDAPTQYAATTCLVYEGGQAIAQLKRCGQRCWGVYPAGMTIPVIFGASSLEAVTAWLSARDGAAS